MYCLSWRSILSCILLYFPAVLEGVRIECHCFNDYSCDQLLVSFTLPGSFPSFRRLSHHHDIISMNITFTTISNTAPPITVPLMVGPKEYQDLRNPGIILRREQLRSIHSQERYRVQLLLIVSGKAANDGSPLCSREWNVYPPRFSDCGKFVCGISPTPQRMRSGEIPLK